jgi:hypothetical protein
MNDSRRSLRVLIAIAGILILVAIRWEPLHISARLWTLILIGCCTIALDIWKKRILESVTARLLARDDRSHFPLPADLTVWSSGWRAFETLDDAELRDLIARCHLLSIATVVIALLGVVAYSVM